MSPNKVLLTGASGFLASHVLNVLLKRGHSVVATVRSQDKADYIHSIFKDLPVETVIVKDVQDPNAFDDVLKNKDITAVIHTASPFFEAKKDPVKELLDPAIKGTKHVLQAIKTFAPQVTKVVITSSYASIDNVSKTYDHSFVHTEQTWSDVTWELAINDLTLSYRGSKTFAEKAFWDFIETEKPNFTGTTINPPFVFGPLLHKASSESLNTSSALLWQSITGGPPNDTSDNYSKIIGWWVDVRDVALAHVLALEKPELAGKRLLVSAGHFSFQLAMDIANKNFPSLKGKIPIGRPGTGNSDIDSYSQIDNHVTTELLGFKNHTLEETVNDSLQNLIDLHA